MPAEGKVRYDSLKVTFKAIRSLERSMNAKYKIYVFISYGLKVTRENSQTDRQTGQKQYVPIGAYW